jgi:serine/threonine protein kinase
MAKFSAGKWKLGDSLGEGGQAFAYLAIDSTGAHPGQVVVKRLRDSGRGNRYPHEVTALKRLQHSKIIAILDHAPLNTTEHRYIVMPYMSGGSLAERAGLYKGQVDPTLDVAEQLAEALACAHAAGIVHRDVKPENVLFETPSDHACKLADFGICFVPDLSPVTDEKEWVGPRFYIAPELEQDGVEPTFAADIYQLGKVIYFMLSGGTHLARERQREPAFAHVWQSADLRVAALARLVDGVVCPIDRRLSDARQVIERLKAVRELASDRRVVSSAASQLARYANQFDADRQHLATEKQNQEIRNVATDRTRPAHHLVFSYLAASESPPFLIGEVQTGGPVRARAGGGGPPPNAIKCSGALSAWPLSEMDFLETAVTALGRFLAHVMAQPR